MFEQGSGEVFRIGIDGVSKFNDRICVSNDPKIKKVILDEAHKSKLSIHPGYHNKVPRP